MLSTDTIAKLGKLIPRLASDHEGEVVATVLAIQRTLQSAGADLHDVVAALNKPPVERIVYREKVVYRDRVVEAPPKADRAAPEFDTSWSCDDVRATADRLLDPNWCDLNKSEAKFVRHMRNSAELRKGQFRMTVR